MLREVKFVQDNAARWKETEQKLLKGNMTSADELAHLYILLTDDLAYAQSFYPTGATYTYLNQLSAKAHQAIYKNKKEKVSMLSRLVMYEIPLAVFESRKLLFISSLVLFIGIVIGALSQAADRDLVYVVLGNEYIETTLQNISSGNPMGIYGSEAEKDMFFFISQNNISVALLAFVTGIFFAIGPTVILFTNGLLLGVLQSFFIQKQLFLTSLTAILLHGTLELSAIILAGGAGILIGSSLLFPGTHPRIYSIRVSSMRALKILLGTIPLFIIAAILESFVTRYYLSIPLAIKILIIGLSIFYMLFYFVLYPSKYLKRRV